MIAILLLTWLALQLVAAIRSKDPLLMAIAIIGVVLAVLVCLGVIAPLRCLTLAG